MIFLSGKREILKGITDSNLLLHLYSNDIDLKEVTHIADFKQPIGFKVRHLYGMFWDIENDMAYMEEELFFDDAIGKIYGYFVSMNNFPLWAERFEDAPLDIGSREDKIKFDITIVMKECKE